MFQLALFQPRIPPNCGNIIRLAANNGCILHLIEPFGFSLDEKSVRRAGLDYHDMAVVRRHKDFQAFTQAIAGHRLLACTTKGSRPYTDINYIPGDVLLFGSETTGLPDDIRNNIPAEHRIRIPMKEGARSMNLANSVSIISYEAWRQHNFAGGV
ncbi:S-adenosyl-L-methionine dependent tRNA/rRNA methyltransferase, SpoU [Thraustotheca clavata]|uniref:S-adenosyl-L-methionine dependent tRNA/rRNA methyltransferase, SpoU n=1 Tax=Thraustotheca clavata TaxID=74557 RepID=A0A1V9ZKN3_9STRA|nr:S-adenosyl-L-methionine dependent tRNA/rRNA methyltransferase, SpoU [Thraustotheca clavata]